MGGAALAQVRLEQPSGQASPAKVVITGRIDTRTLMEFATIVGDPRLAGTSAPVLELDSRGGSVHAAMAIGLVARNGGFDTYVGRHSSCDSACVLILVAGADQRIIEGRVGVHSPRVVHGDPGSRAALYFETVTAMRHYLARMGAADGLLNAMLSAPPHGLRRLSPGEFKALGLASAGQAAGPAREVAPAQRPFAPLPQAEAFTGSHRKKSARGGQARAPRDRIVSAIVARGPPPGFWSATAYDSRYDRRRAHPRPAVPAGGVQRRQTGRAAALNVPPAVKRGGLRTAGALPR